ncbi:MAG: PEP-CTERM system histidine kinase PrsK [Candidatus Tectomicrobia bacterium]|uniref:histidine kinase n=1 Tax=Tectimicrobiota bacterium TaxID=2528274 RepID=A0A932CQB4_UNCTE|nr:PEP-CTERM system histidine kinase PrsK [Candidatus Tectomicrobia bacterium]
MRLIAFPSLLSALISLAMALFVLVRVPRRLSHWAFILGLLSLFVLEMGNFWVLQSGAPQEILFWKRISLVGEIFLPASWLLFSLVLARSNHRAGLDRWRWVLGVVFLTSLGFLGLTPADDFLREPQPDPGSLGLDAIPLGRAGYLFYQFFLLGAVLILANLEHTLRSLVEPRRSQVKLLLLGVGGLFAFSIYLSGQALLYSQLRLSDLPLASSVHLVCLGMVIVSLARYGLLQAEVFVSRQVVYHTLTFLIAGGYLLAVGLLAQGLRSLGEGLAPDMGPFLVFLASLGLVAFFLSARYQSRIRVFIGTHFYRNKYDYRSLWQRFTERLGPTLSVEEILSLAKGLLLETLGIQRIHFWLYDHPRKRFCLMHPRNLPPRTGGGGLKEGNGLVQYLFQVNRPVTQEELRENPALRPIWEENCALLESLESSAWVPLVAGERKIGLMTLGKGASGKGFDHEDCELLKALSVPISHHLLAARLAEELIATKQVETFSRLAAFVLHDLKNFTSSLSLVVQNARASWEEPDFRQDALGTISNIAARMKGLIDRLSVSSVTGLQRRPVDLNALISETLQRLNGARKIAFLPSDRPLPLAEVDGDEIQKVILNLVLNAHEAILDQGKVTIRTEAQNGWVTFAVTDEGCGIPEEVMADSLFLPFKTTKDQGTGIGLYQCKRVIEAHQGEIEVESQPGRGSTFRVKLPVMKVTRN